MTLEEFNDVLRELFFEQNPKFNNSYLRWVGNSLIPVFDKYGKLHLIDFRYYNEHLEEHLWKSKQ